MNNLKPPGRSPSSTLVYWWVMSHTWMRHINHSFGTQCNTLQHTATHCNTLQHIPTAHNCIDGSCHTHEWGISTILFVFKSGHKKFFKTPGSTLVCERVISYTWMRHTNNVFGFKIAYMNKWKPPGKSPSSTLVCEWVMFACFCKRAQFSTKEPYKRAVQKSNIF